MSHSNARVQKAQVAFLYATPAIVLLYYLATVIVSVCTLQTGRKRKLDRLRNATAWCINSILITYLAQCIDLFIDSTSPTSTISTVPANINATLSTLLWFLIVIVFQASKRPVLHPYLGACLVTLVLEVVAFSLCASHALSKAVEHILLAIQSLRFALLLLLLAFHARAWLASTSARADEESASLLTRPSVLAADLDGSTKSAGNYGSIVVTQTSHSNSADSDDSDNSDDDDSHHSFTKAAKVRQRLMKRRLKKEGNWFTYLRGFSIFLPLIWPTKRPRLYLNMAGCVVCILCVRIFKLLQPWQLGIVVNTLASDSGSGSLYTAIGLYVIYGWIASGVGQIQDILWYPVKQNSQLQISTAAYNQIMDLSSDYHDEKQTGELYTSISQGSSVSQLLETLCFELGPMALDLVVAYVYLYHLFGPYMAIVAAATTLAYLSSNLQLNSKLSKPRRNFVDLVRKENQVMYDTVGSWTTISYFNRFSFEKKRYQGAVSLSLTARQRYYILGDLFQSATELVTTLGLCGALCLAAHQVAHGKQSIGTFVTLFTYWAIFIAPLRFLANTHKTLLSNLVDAEQLLQLFKQKPAVEDGPNNFLMKRGAVEFRNVKFSYDGIKQIINGVSFSAKPGQKVALVGQTGGGKSTLLKLLFRFYDVRDGSVLIDDQDVRDVTVESLRERIGVVPQDPSMFNDTVMNNVRYSRLDATDEEVMEACRAAAVHDKILSFTNGYASKVGEKGVKLSGGELQRLAIARAILKDPAIILLDEATSSVDTETEIRIQSALHELTKGRTTFTVAHRLSTVVDADVILVIKDGLIVEQGHPKELLEAKGAYHGLWCKQVGIASETLEEPKDTTNKLIRAHSESEEAQTGMTEGKKAFRPDAPIFIPSYLQGNKSSTNNADTNTGSLPQRLQDEGTKGNGSSQGKRQRAREHGTKIVASANTDQATDQAKSSAPDGTETATAQSATDGERPNFDRVRRRRLSKSETAEPSVSMGEGHADEAAAPSEGPGKLPASQNRRVSAPSSSTVDGKTAPPSRRNGRKHWRARDKNSSNSQSAPGTWSGRPPPSAPPPTPAQTDNGIEDSKGESKGSVHFAQDS
ncbi:MAG: hypothetical protein Q9182_005807 [Xanthomendoza sp. 2 TL-2023]